MTIRKLPKPAALKRPANYDWDARTDALEQWAHMPTAAAEAEDPNTIAIFDVIGEDPWSGGGFTAKRLAGALRAIGKNDVTIKINSPGGDMFEGIAIYNLLREHPAKVTVSIVGIAASAASIIAMAADEISMGLGTFLMVHNAWGMVVGNRHDMREAADIFESFDAALADIYEARTGLTRREVEKLMDAETFMGPSEAVAKGFADTIDEGVDATAAANNAAADDVMPRRRLEAALAGCGKSRKERRRLVAEAVDAELAERDAGQNTRAVRDAGQHAERDAGDLTDLANALRDLKSLIAT